MNNTVPAHDDARNQTTRMPSPGTREYDEFVDQQGQAAMDSALSHPVARIVAALLFLCGLTMWPVTVVNLVSGRAWWQAALFGAGMSVVWLGFLVEIGYVAALGKSRTPWFKATVRRWRRRRTGSP